jgi:serine/threonine protein kinase
MRRSLPGGIDVKSPPFDQIAGIQPLAPERSGHASNEHVRHLLYAGRDRRTRTGVLIKVSAKAGRVYEHNLLNEIASLTTINRELAESRYFPVVGEHGRLDDGRVFLTMSFFDQLPLASTIGPDRMPSRLVAHVRLALEVASALAELHRLGIFHVDLNPMNVLYRSEQGRPVIRIVDFESSYEVTRHGAGDFYNPPTTTGYSAPEVPGRAPDARADVFSLGAVLYTTLAGYRWSWAAAPGTCIAADPDLDPELKGILLGAVDPDPERRYADVGELRAPLAAYLERIWPGRAW